jgi:hypothetical protein
VMMLVLDVLVRRNLEVVLRVHLKDTDEEMCCGISVAHKKRRGRTLGIGFVLEASSFR